MGLIGVILALGAREVVNVLMTNQLDLRAAVADLAALAEQFTPSTREVPGTRSAVPIARYRDRLIGLDELRSELQQMGYRGLELARLIQSSIWDRDRDFKGDLINQFRLAFNRGLIGVDGLRSALVVLGLGDAERNMELALASVHRAVVEGAIPEEPIDTQL